MVEEVSSEAPFSTQKCSPNASESREREVGETFSSPKLPPEASWAALGPPRGSKEVDFKSPCCILHRFGSSGGVRRPSGEPLGPLWALLGRLLALPGVFLGVSEAISAAVGQEA